MASQAQLSQAQPAAQRQGQQRQQRQQPTGSLSAAGNAQWLAVVKEVLTILLLNLETNQVFYLGEH